MTALFYIGDEASAAGFRLAGAEVATPLPGGEGAALAQARKQASLVLVSAAVAARIPARELARAEIGIAPLVLMVPALDGDFPSPDLAMRLRGQLGLEDPR